MHSFVKYNKFSLHYPFSDSSAITISPYTLKVSLYSTFGKCCDRFWGNLTFTNTILCLKINGNTGGKQGVFLYWPMMHTVR